MTTSDEIVRARDLRRRFGHSYALRGINLTVNPHEIVALVGPNGSGKTTLLRILATLLHPSSGEVFIFGMSPRIDGSKIRRKISFLGHNPGLYEDLTAMENLVFFSQVYGVPATPSKLTRILAEFGLEERKDAPVKEFSRGMKQRLALVRSAVHDARLYLWDEPLTGLDSRAVETTLETMDRLRRQGAAILFSSHILPSPLPENTRIIYLESGRITDHPQKVLTAVTTAESAIPSPSGASGRQR